MSHPKPQWTQGIIGDGAAILRDGVPVEIEDVVAGLNRMEEMRLIHAPRGLGKGTPPQTLRNLSAEELADHVALGGALPHSAVKHLAMLAEQVNSLAHSITAGHTGPVETIKEVTARPLEGWNEG